MLRMKKEIWDIPETLILKIKLKKCLKDNVQMHMRTMKRNTQNK